MEQSVALGRGRRTQALLHQRGIPVADRGGLNVSQLHAAEGGNDVQLQLRPIELGGAWRQRHAPDPALAHPALGIVSKPDRTGLLVEEAAPIHVRLGSSQPSPCIGLRGERCRCDLLSSRQIAISRLPPPRVQVPDGSKAPPCRHHDESTSRGGLMRDTSKCSDASDRLNAWGTRPGQRGWLILELSVGQRRSARQALNARTGRTFRSSRAVDARPRTCARSFGGTHSGRGRLPLW
jgi:hypothetical protein